MDDAIEELNLSIQRLDNEITSIDYDVERLLHQMRLMISERNRLWWELVVLEIKNENT